MEPPANDVAVNVMTAPLVLKRQKHVSSNQCRRGQKGQVRGKARKKQSQFIGFSSE